MQRSKKLLFGVFAVLIGTSVGVYAAEIVFRNALLVPFVPVSDADFEQIVAENWPAHIDPVKKPGTLRVLGLADSFGTNGGAGNYHFQAEELLRARGHDVEFVNLSVPGYSLEHEVLLLQRFGARYEPDFVLHGFFVGNDFGLGEQPSLRYRGIRVNRIDGLSGWLPHNLTLTRWLPKWGRARTEQRLQTEDEARGLGDGSFSEASFLEVERIRFGTCRRPKTEGPAWLGITGVLDQLGRAVDELGAVHLMVVHPDQFQIEPELERQIIDTFELDRSLYDLDQPQKFLRAYAQSRALPMLDLTPAFREVGSEGGYFLLRDSHYNEAGNRLAAGALAEAMEPRIAAMVAARN